MSYTRDFYGTNYTIPARRETGWATWVSDFLIAIAEKLTGTPQTVDADIALTDIDCSAGHNVTLNLLSNTEITLSNLPEGDRAILFVSQTGSFAITWADTIMWRGGSSPTITSGAGALDILTVFNHPDLGFIGDFAQDYS